LPSAVGTRRRLARFLEELADRGECVFTLAVVLRLKRELLREPPDHQDRVDDRQVEKLLANAEDNVGCPAHR
jgi:hypothetical protein